jgi:hypothetical protein
MKKQTSKNYWELDYEAVVQWAERKNLNTETQENWREAAIEMGHKLSATSFEMPNGLTSYTETFFFISENIIKILVNEKTSNNNGIAIIHYRAKHGMIEVVALIRKWTIQFEMLNFERLWDDDDFCDEVEEFCLKKLEELSKNNGG